MALAVPITGLYAAIQAVIVTILVFPIGRLRTSLGVSLNDGGKCRAVGRDSPPRELGRARAVRAAY